MRLTDTGGGQAATAQDFTFPVTMPCTATASTSVGATCGVATTLDAVTPGAVTAGARAIWELAGVEVLDGDGARFARQGIFVP